MYQSSIFSSILFLTPFIQQPGDQRKQKQILKRRVEASDGTGRHRKRLPIGGPVQPAISIDVKIPVRRCLYAFSYFYGTSVFLTPLPQPLRMVIFDKTAVKKHADVFRNAFRRRVFGEHGKRVDFSLRRQILIEIIFQNRKRLNIFRGGCWNAVRVGSPVQQRTVLRNRKGSRQRRSARYIDRPDVVQNFLRRIRLHIAPPKPQMPGAVVSPAPKTSVCFQRKSVIEGRRYLRHVLHQTGTLRFVITFFP